MSIDYDVVLVVGKKFDNIDRAIEYYCSKVDIPESELSKLESDFSGFLDNGDPYLPIGGMLNHYTGNGYWIGYQLDTDSVQEFSKSIEDAANNWRTVFQEEPEIICEVCVW